MVNGWDILGAISGAVGIGSSLFAVFYYQLPRNKLCNLDRTLEETEGFLFSGLEGGLIPDSRLASQFMQSVEELRFRTECIRPEVYRAKTLWQQVKGVGSGLTKEVSMILSDVKDLRADVTAMNSRERERRRQEPQIVHPRPAVAEGVVTDGASASVSLGGPGAPVSGVYNLESTHVVGLSGFEVTLVDRASTGSVTIGFRSSGDAETAHIRPCGGRGRGRRLSSPLSRPRVISCPHATSSLPFEGEDEVYDCAERATVHPGPRASPDILPPSEMPRYDVCASVDTFVHNAVHRCSR